MQRVHPAIAVAAVLVLAVCGGFVLARDGRSHLAELAIGDAMAYLRIAWHIGRGDGSTWDGLQPTNGYHPLWLLLHLPLQWGAETPLTRLWAARLLWSGTAIAAAAAWGAVLYRATGRALPAAIAAMGIGGTGWSVFVLCTGMETPLALLTLAGVFLADDRLREQASVDRAAALGGALGLAFLARLDTVFLLVLVAGAAALRLRADGRALVALIGAGASVTFPYLAWNLMNFGALQPVSGVVKTRTGPLDLRPLWSWWGDISGIATRAGIPAEGALAAVVLLGAAGLILGGGPLFAATRARMTGLRWLPVGAALHYGYYALRITELNVPWHVFQEVAAVVVLGALATDALAQRFLRSPRAEGALAAVLALGLLGSDVLYAKLKAVRRDEVRLGIEAGEWLAGQPEGTTILMFDSWMMGIYAEQQHAVDLSGLVGDAEMARMAKARDLAGIAARFDADGLAILVPRTCEPKAEALLWASRVGESRTPVQLYVLNREAMHRGIAALSDEERRGYWALPLRDAVVCGAR